MITRSFFIKKFIDIVASPWISNPSYFEFLAMLNGISSNTYAAVLLFKSLESP